MRILTKICLSGIIAIGILFAGCEKRPEGVLSDSEMEDLMTDLALAEAYSQSGEYMKLPDSVRSRLGEAVLKKHGVDRATLDSTYSWYARNLEDYYRIYDRVDRRLEKLRRKAGVNLSNEIENNIWNLPDHFMLSPTGYGNALTFRIPGENVAGGEQLRWKMKMYGSSSVDILLGIDYADGTSSVVRREFQGGNIDVTLITDTALKAKSIYGFLQANRKDMPLWVDSISLAKNPYDSLQYNNIHTQRKIYPPRKIIPKLEKPDSVSISDSPADPVSGTSTLPTTVTDRSSASESTRVPHSKPGSRLSQP